MIRNLERKIGKNSYKYFDLKKLILSYIQGASGIVARFLIQI
jgi:hypothetical protein